MLIPDKVLLFFLPLFIAGRMFSPLDSWYAGFAGAVCGFALLVFIMFVSKGGIGAGDVKLFGVIGLTLGVKLVLEHELHAERQADHPKQFHITCADASFTDKHDKNKQSKSTNSSCKPRIP